jgi:hypothetical protein
MKLDEVDIECCEKKKYNERSQAYVHPMSIDAVHHYHVYNFDPV